MNRPVVSGLALLSFVAVGGCGSAPEPAAPPPPLQRIELPASVSFPEGLAYDASANALYTGSAADGLLVRIHAGTGAVDTVAAAGTLVPAKTTTFPALLGMEIDIANRLWIAGGRTGKVWVVNVADGKVLREVTVPKASVGKSLLNDVAIVEASAYITDTFVPTLWRLSVKGSTVGDLEPWLDLTKTPIAYGDGPNLNGITATLGGQTLIVVQMNKGLLFKIDVGSKAVTPIDTGGADLSGADGLVLDGRTLYVVRQTAVEIATVALSNDMSSGKVVSRFKDPALAWPATAAKVGDTLIVVNTQFNTRDNNTTARPFTLVRVPIARLAG